MWQVWIIIKKGIDVPNSLGPKIPRLGFEPPAPSFELIPVQPHFCVHFSDGKRGVLQKSAFFSMNSNGIICFVDNNRNNDSISLPKLSSSTYDELSEQNQTMPLCRQYLATGYGKP